MAKQKKTTTKVEAPSPETVSARALYNGMAGDHTAPLQRARDASALTIPSLMPPEGTSDASQLEQPYQSLGARGVNNLASKLLMALFPPGQSPFKYNISKEAREAAGEEDISEVQMLLAQRETDIMDHVEASPQRPILFGYFLHLVVCGNALLYYPDLENMQMFGLDQYRVRRTPAGKPLDVAILEKVSPRALEANIAAACEVDVTSEEDVEMYTAIMWRGGTCYWWQTINDFEVPGTRSQCPANVSPWIVGRWKAMPNNHYGRGHVEELMGDLISYDGICQAIVQFAAAAAKILFLKKPSSTTRLEDVVKAESGDVIVGSKDDIDVLQIEKFADFQVVHKTAEGIEMRLAQAFLLRSGATRDAERVTAEEIRAIAQELEDVNGGVYTVQSQDLQMPWVNRTVFVLEKAKRINVLPEGTVTPVIVTGFQALGRNHQLNQLRGAVQDLVNLLGPEVAYKLLKGTTIATRVFTDWGVTNIAELLKTTDEVAQEEAAANQQAMQAEMLSKAAGPVAQGVAKGDIAIPTM